MNMEFVTFEIAKKLKEKGYPQVKKDSLAMYNQDGDWFSLASNLDTFEYSFEDFDDNDCVCPTISQVLKWLREKKNIEVVASFSYRDRVWGYQVGDMTLSEDSILAYDYSLPTYEQATIEGIKYVVDNLI